jgi:hypothetical protein
MRSRLTSTWQVHRFDRRSRSPIAYAINGVVPGVGHPASRKFDDLDVICAVLGCEIGELLIAEPETVSRPGDDG